MKSLAEDIVRTQEAEIEALRSIKQQEFGTSEVAMEMGSEEVETIGVTDPRQLAEARPFDRAFIDAMIPHHESAIQMAQVAYGETQNPDIKALASDISEVQPGKSSRWREPHGPSPHLVLLGGRRWRQFRKGQPCVQREPAAVGKPRYAQRVAGQGCGREDSLDEPHIVRRGACAAPNMG